jgi:hypothetical protein
MAPSIRVSLLIGMLVILAAGVSGCGAGSGEVAYPASQSTITIITATVLPTATPSLRSSPIPGGQVTVTIGAAHYGATATVDAAINNGTGGVISTSDHQTSCKYVSLQRYVNGIWERQRPCPLLSPARIVNLPPGATPQPLAPGSTPWPTGLYRVAFSYFMGTDAGTASGSGVAATLAPGGPVYSAIFTVG